MLKITLSAINLYSDANYHVWFSLKTQFYSYDVTCLLVI